MSNIKLREEVIFLRKRNLSYSQIKDRLGVPKSTLSSWLKDYPLPKSIIRKLRDRNESRIEKFRQTMAKKRELRLEEIYSTEKNKIKKLSKRDIMFTGLALYWGEGSKSDWSKVAITNTDPDILNFFIVWLKTIYKINKKNLTVTLHLYNDMKIKKETNYWSKILDVSHKQFRKPYIKNTNLSRINHKGGFGHGTCRIAFYSVELKQKIMMQLRLLAETAKYAPIAQLVRAPDL